MMLRMLGTVALILSLYLPTYPQTSEITTQEPQPSSPPLDTVPMQVEAPLLHVKGSVMLQSAPLMEIIGIHAELRLEDPFGRGSVRALGIATGIGYSVYTPHFLPLQLRSLWGRYHLLEIGVGSSIPLNPVYGTNAQQPLTWGSRVWNPTVLVGYRFEKESVGLQYRVFMQFLLVPGVNSGLLPCLGGSAGWVW